MPDSISLQNLHDIVVPAPVSWLPPAPGWYALGLTILLLLLWGAMLWYRRWKRNAYRREALAELDRFEAAFAGNGTVSELLPRLPELLKRTAIAAYGRGEVASLSGKSWLDFLDHSMGKPLFSGERGGLLLTCSYGSPGLLDGISREQVQNLCRDVHTWLAGHRADTADRASEANTLNAGGGCLTHVYFCKYRVVFSFYCTACFPAAYQTLS